MKEKTLQISETEERILSAALKVINEKTISGTRVHLIAEKAEVAQSNVHYYYKTKQDLMEKLQERVLEEFYDVRRNCKVKDTLESRLHVFFEQKKYMVLKKKNYDFAELNFLVQSKIDKKMKERFQNSYSEWRDDIRETIIRYCPKISEEDKEIIPYIAISLLEGASVQALVDSRDFDADRYFETAEKMILEYIENAVKKAEGENKG